MNEEGGDIRVGDIREATGVAIGPGARAAVYQGLSVEEVAALVVELKRKDQPAVWDGRVPYLGLNAFQESDYDFFFGREGLVDNLLEWVERARFITIAGPSGSGKSSIARAGLFHALREGRLERSEKWLLATMQPKGDSLGQLTLSIDRLAGKLGTADIIRDKGLDDPLALHKLSEVLLTDDRRQRFVLLVDQFEELFTQTRNEDERSAFIDLLTTAAEVENGRTTIVISLRSDFVSNCAKYPALRNLLSEEFQLVGAMAPRDLAKAITLPSLEVGAEIDPALVKQIIDDMKGEPGALPLMSFALRDLFEAEKTAKGEAMDLTLPEYLDRGGIESALERHADNVFGSFTAEQQALAKSIFSRLIEIGQDGVADTRRTVMFDELVPAGANRDLVAATVSKLAEKDVRLITTSGVDTEKEITVENLVDAQTTVTIAHERLIDAWPWLRQLVAENREIITLQNRISTDARDWAKEEDVGFLYSSGRLLNVEEQLDTIGPNLDDLSQRFLVASFAEKQRRIEEEEANLKREEDLRGQKRVGRILRWATAIVGVLLLVAVFLGFQSLNNANRAENARSTSDANAVIANSESTRAIEAQETAIYSEEQAISARGTAEAESTRSISAEQIAETEREEAVEARATSDSNAEVAATSEAEVAALKDLIQASQLAAASGVALSTDQELALRLATMGLGMSRRLDTLVGFYGAVLAPFRHSLEGHAGAIRSAEFSPDGRYIVTAGTDDSVKVWDVEGNELASLEGHTDWVATARFSPDGKQIVTASADGSAKVWDLEGDEVSSLNGHTDWVWSARFSPDGQMIVTAGADGMAKLWDVDGNEIALLDGHSDQVRSADFSPDGELIVTASEDGSAKVWDTLGNELRSLDGHTALISSAHFSPDGEKIVTASDDKSAKIWGVNGIELASLEGHTSLVHLANFSPDGEKIVTAGADDSAKVWDVDSNELASLDGHLGTVWSASFSPDGERIVTASEDGSARVWNLRGNEVASLNRHSEQIYTAVFSPDGKQIVTAGSDGTAKIWSLVNNELAVLEGHTNWVWSAIFSNDGQLIVTAGNDGLAKIWNLEGDELVSLEGHASTVVLNISPDGQQIVTGGSYSGVKVWDLEGNELANLEGHHGSIKSVEFSPDGRHILSASIDDSAKVWDLHGNELVSFDGHTDGVLWASYSPDGMQIITASMDGSAKIWDLAGNELASLEGHDDWVNMASFSPDGQKILTASDDTSAKVWDLDGNELIPLDGHRGVVRSAVFSPDGQKILTASWDSSAKVWDLEGNELTSLDGHNDRINSAIFSPDEEYIITASGDGSAKVWDMEGNELFSMNKHSDEVTWASFSPDMQHIVTTSYDQSAKVWAFYPTIADKVAVVRERLSRSFSENECRRFFLDDPGSCPRTLEELFALFDDELESP